jgi:hypothetical protein
LIQLEDLEQAMATHKMQECWCGSIGSVEEMQAKVLKKQEAATKRAREMAYALTHQHQVN